MIFNLKGKVAVVTGAGSGMGRTHAIALARQGAKVAVTGIVESACLPVAEEINKSGGEAICLKMDVADRADVDRAFDEIIAKFGRVDILVNNAGIYKPKPALDLSEEEWGEMININLKGQFLCAQRAAREMMKNKWGRIINIASIASGSVGIGFAGAAHYAASKGGIIGMSETLAIEWAEYGITVNVVGPGAIDTPMVRQEGTELSKEMMDMIKLRVPLKRIGKPEEVSALVAFLASDESSYITGSTFYADGGWLAA